MKFVGPILLLTGLLSSHVSFAMVLPVATPRGAVAAGATPVVLTRHSGAARVDGGFEQHFMVDQVVGPGAGAGTFTVGDVFSLKLEEGCTLLADDEYLITYVNRVSEGKNVMHRSLCHIVRSADLTAEVSALSTLLDSFEPQPTTAGEPLVESWLIEHKAFFFAPVDAPPEQEAVPHD